MSLQRILRRNQKLRQSGQLPGAIGSSFEQLPSAPTPVGRVIEQRATRVRLPLMVSEPCRHEGAVLEYCTACGSKGEAKHIRDCGLQTESGEEKYERCTRGFVSHLVQCCARCPDYTLEKTVEALIPIAPSQPPVKEPEPTVYDELPTPIAPPTEEEQHSPVMIAASLVEIKDINQKRKKIPPTWAYGLTTVLERRDDILPRTLASLVEAGFGKPRLFVDGDDDVHEWRTRFSLETTCRYPRIKTYGNWILSLAELYIREPRRTYYAMFQDDFVAYKNLRQYLEKIPYPEKGYMNLYTFPKNQVKAPKEVGFYRSNQKGLGAVALVFNEEAVINLIIHQHMVLRPRDQFRGHKAVDGGIVTAMNKVGFSEYVHNPSLIQHTGMKSTMGNIKHPEATSFRGENYDALSLLSRG